MMNLDSSTASLIMRLRQEPGQPARPRFATEYLQAWFEVCDVELGKVLKIAVKIDAIRNDKSLSLQGQQAQYAVLAPQAIKEVASPVLKPLNEVKGAIARLTALMLDPITAVPKGSDPTITFLREQELRREIPKSEAPKAYLNALASDDLETARALLNAPGAPRLSEDIKRRGQEEFAKRTNPTAFAQRASLDYYQDHLQSLVEQLRNWLLALGATPEMVNATFGD